MSLYPPLLFVWALIPWAGVGVGVERGARGPRSQEPQPPSTAGARGGAGGRPGSPGAADSAEASAGRGRSRPPPAPLTSHPASARRFSCLPGRSPKRVWSHVASAASGLPPRPRRGNHPGPAGSPAPLHSYHGPRGGRDQAPRRGGRRLAGEAQARLLPRGSPLLALRRLPGGERPCSVFRRRQVGDKPHQLGGSAAAAAVGGQGKERARLQRRERVLFPRGEGPPLAQVTCPAPAQRHRPCPGPAPFQTQPGPRHRGGKGDCGPPAAGPARGGERTAMGRQPPLLGGHAGPGGSGLQPPAPLPQPP